MQHVNIDIIGISYICIYINISDKKSNAVAECYRGNNFCYVLKEFMKYYFHLYVLSDKSMSHDVVLGRDFLNAYDIEVRFRWKLQIN